MLLNFLKLKWITSFISVTGPDWVYGIHDWSILIRIEQSICINWSRQENNFLVKTCWALAKYANQSSKFICAIKTGGAWKLKGASKNLNEHNGVTKELGSGAFQLLNSEIFKLYKNSRFLIHLFFTIFNCHYYRVIVVYSLYNFLNIGNPITKAIINKPREKNSNSLAKNVLWKPNATKPVKLKIRAIKQPRIATRNISM